MVIVPDVHPVGSNRTYLHLCWIFYWKEFRRDTTSQPFHRGTLLSLGFHPSAGPYLKMIMIIPIINKKRVKKST